jgi:hypothetical protein
VVGQPNRPGVGLGTAEQKHGDGQDKATTHDSEATRSFRHGQQSSPDRYRSQ